MGRDGVPWLRVRTYVVLSLRRAVRRDGKEEHPSGMERGWPQRRQDIPATSISQLHDSLLCSCRVHHAHIALRHLNCIKTQV